MLTSMCSTDTQMFLSTSLPFQSCPFCLKYGFLCVGSCPFENPLIEVYNYKDN